MMTDPYLQARIALLRQAVAGDAPPEMYFELAEALAEAGEPREAGATFRRGYLLQPSIYPLLGEGLGGTRAELEARRDYAATLAGNGAGFSPVLAALAVAEAHLGNSVAVRRLVDHERFFHNALMALPDDLDRADFNRALAAEILSGLKYYDRPSRHAIRRAWRQNDIMASSLPALQRWGQLIRDTIDRYIAALPAARDHPFLAARPADYAIESWALSSDGESFHMPHIHPRAWMSGVYYVSRPEISRAPGGLEGWLHVGPPAMHGVSAEQGWAERMVAPEPGSLVMMPAYFYHWTKPMGVDEERICLVFDVVPVELAEAGTGDDRDDGAG